MDPRRLNSNDPSLETFESILPGFRSIVDFNLGYLDVWLDWLEDHGYERPDPQESIFHHLSEQIPEGRFCDEPAFYAAEHSDTAFLTHHVCHTIRNHKSEGWFIHLSLLRPHPPLIAPAPFHRLYEWRDLPLPKRENSMEGDAAMHPLLELWQRKIDTEDYFSSQANMLQLCDEDILRAKAVYLGLITEVDQNLGKIFDLLKETEQWEETLIIFTSDHGEQLGDHYLWGKGGCFDPSWHIPLIIRDPKNPFSHGIEVSAFSEHVDITPTILAWLDQEIPPAMDGRSLLHLLQTEELEGWKTGIFCEFDWRSLPQKQVRNDEERQYENHQLCLWRDDDFKYVHFTNHPPLLFDLKNDPYETKNLAEDPAYISICNRYLSNLLKHRMQHSDRNLTLWQLTDDQ
jgi:arylsulfatase A-like enzyme